MEAKSLYHLDDNPDHKKGNFETVSGYKFLYKISQRKAKKLNAKFPKIDFDLLAADLAVSYGNNAKISKYATKTEPSLICKAKSI